jgi:hypothetical protein
MFAGLPHFCKSGAKTPMKAPTEMIPQRVAKKFLMVVIVTPFQENYFGMISQLVTDNCRREGKDGRKNSGQKRMKTS